MIERPDATLRLMAYNIRHGAGMDGRVDLARIADVIGRCAPHIVLLQEVDECCGRTGGIDQMQTLGELTGLHSHFGAFRDFDGGRYGMGALSTAPLSEPSAYGWHPGDLPRCWIAVQSAWGTHWDPVVFSGIHLYTDVELRLQQAARVCDLFAAASHPVVLAGDFNCEPGAPAAQRLDQHWQRAPKEGERLTFPADIPTKEIDFVFARPAPHICVQRCWVEAEAMASDHRPVLAELALNTAR
jgi:endonuclease/exonuclease/phosphatase family metal-dependent hydrolase